MLGVPIKFLSALDSFWDLNDLMVCLQHVPGQNANHKEWYEVKSTSLMFRSQSLNDISSIILWVWCPKDIASEGLATLLKDASLFETIHLMECSWAKSNLAILLYLLINPPNPRLILAGTRDWSGAKILRSGEGKPWEPFMMHISSISFNPFSLSEMNFSKRSDRQGLSWWDFSPFSNWSRPDKSWWRHVRVTSSRIWYA